MKCLLRTRCMIYSYIKALLSSVPLRSSRHILRGQTNRVNPGFDEIRQQGRLTEATSAWQALPITKIRSTSFAPSLLNVSQPSLFCNIRHNILNTAPRSSWQCLKGICYSLCHLLGFSCFHSKQYSHQQLTEKVKVDQRYPFRALYLHHAST